MLCINNIACSNNILCTNNTLCNNAIDLDISEINKSISQMCILPQIDTELNNSMDTYLKSYSGVGMFSSIGTFSNSSPQLSIGTQSNVKRIIIIDGQNIALNHGKSIIFSCKGIQIAIDYFKNLGHEVKVLLPKWRSFIDSDINKRQCVDFNLLTVLDNNNYIYYTPENKKINGSTIQYDMYKYLLNICERINGIIVTQYKFKHLLENKKYEDIINNRILYYSFIGDIFIIPDDPCGKYGPDIDEFLKIK